jgi:hypothetical protein
MHLRHLLATAVFAFSTFAASSSQAALVTYDLTNVVFNDGGTATGSFTFNTTTDTYTSWSITTTATTNLAANGYLGLNGAYYSTNTLTNASQDYYLNPYGVDFVNAAGDNLSLLFTSPLTTPGATTIALGNIHSGDGAESENDGFRSRTITGGSISAVPLPASLPMFGLAVLGLAAFGLRKARKLQPAQATA